jgi:cell division protein FtsL
MKKTIKTKKPKLMILVTIVAFGLALAQLTITYGLSTTGGRMRQLEEKAETLSQQNRVLTEEINQMGSLTRIAQQAQSLGLVKANQVLYLVPQVPVALGNTTVNPGR